MDLWGAGRGSGVPIFDTSLRATYDLRDHAKLQGSLLSSNLCAQRDGRCGEKHCDEDRRDEDRRYSPHPGGAYIFFSGGAGGNSFRRSASLPG